MSFKIKDSELIELASTKTIQECAEYFGVNRETIGRYKKRLGLEFKKPEQHLHSEETKKTISEKRKKWLKENPERHPWRAKDKFKSEPCEKAKEFLNKLKIPFISEYSPEINGRFFSIDIALPDKMIALEVNGNQHYERSGKLKPYYQERHDLLESAGWIVYEIHYSACFNLDKWSEFVDRLKVSPVKVEFDYFNYVPRKKRRRKKPFKVKSLTTKILKEKPPKILKEKSPKKHKEAKEDEEYEKHFCIDCGVEINYLSTRCRKCNSISRIGAKQKINWPTNEELQKFVFLYPLRHLGEKLGVSDNAVRKRCKTRGIELPKSGYWQKLNSGWTKEEILNGKPEKPKPIFLSEQDKNDIKLKFVNGVSRKELAAFYKKHISYIGKIINDKF